MKPKPHTLWLFGMPNSGKTTLAYNLLQDRLRNYFIIDGDAYRQALSPSKWKFTKKAVMQNNESAAKLARYAMDQGFNVLVAMITPYEKGRQIIKNILDDKIVFVWVDAPLKERKKRPNFRESKIKFEMPSYTDTYLNTSTTSIKDCTKDIYHILEDRGFKEREFTLSTPEKISQHKKDLQRVNRTKKYVSIMRKTRLPMFIRRPLRRFLTRRGWLS